MADYIAFNFTDGSSVLLQAFPVAPDDTTAGNSADDDLPEGLDGAVPVARVPRQVAEFGQQALRTTLSPLVPLLQEIHDCVAKVPNAPQTVSVEMGIRVGGDLKLGIVSGSSDVTMKLTATWQH